MPNWATGTLKIRGTREDILDFCKKELSERANPSHFKTDDGRTVTWKMELADSEYDNGDLFATVHGDPSLCIWLKDSRRNFIEMDTDVPYYWDVEYDGKDYETRFAFYQTPEKDYCVVFPFQAAWGVDEDYYADLSKKYGLIFRIYTVEQGMGFFSEFEAKDGKVEVLASGPSIGPEGEGLRQSYGRFVWECPFPFLGG